jgi:ligand-binding sensor domain-containing protein
MLKDYFISNIKCSLQLVSLLMVTNLYIAFGQDQIQFDRLAQVKGLENRSISAIVQDSIGFLWFGTQDGLIRFDGYETRVYKNILKDKNSLGDNNVRALKIDKKGNLWIATQGGGLDKFNIRTEQFTHYRNLPEDQTTISGNAVWSLHVDAKGMIWAGTWSNGLNRLDPHTNKFTRIAENKYVPVLAILEDKNGSIWFSSAGINRVDTASLSVRNFVPGAGSPRSLSEGGIRALFQDGTGKIWIGTENAGLFQFSEESTEYSKFEPKNTTSSLNSIYALHHEPSRGLWIGSNEGITILNDGKLISSKFSPSDKYSLSTNSVRALYTDNTGTTWVGHEGGGVNKLFSKKSFQLYQHSALAGSISHNLIRSIFEDKKGKLWVGTQGGGLNVFDRNTNTFTVFPLGGKEISNIFEDQDGTFWIGSWGAGLFHYNPITKKSIAYRHEGDLNSLPDDRIQIVHRDKTGILWVGTENGLSQFDESNAFWEPFQKPQFPISLKGSNVQGQAFVETDDGSIWIGTWFGLNQISADRKAINYYTADTTAASYLSSEHVISLCLDKNKQLLWIGTFGGGLNCLNLTDQSISSFTEDNGLPNNTIFGIKQDDKGNLWLSTNNGLSRFNPTSRIFRNYDATEGLQGNEFYWGAACKTKDGTMLFGGVNGLNVFNPNEITDNATVPPVVITDVEIFNKPLSVKPNSLLDQNINFINELRLNYDQNVISFQFASLNFNSTEKNLYAYYLENFDKDWNYIGDKRSISYTNLSPGNYILHIKGSNNDGVWNEKGISLKVKIIPPFWRTWWFYLFVFLVALFVVYLVVRLRNQSIKRDKELIRQTLQAELNKVHNELDLERRAVLAEQNKNIEKAWIDQSMLQISNILSSSKDNVDKLCQGIISALVKRCEVMAGAIYLFDESSTELVKRANYGFENARMRISSESGQVGACYTDRKTVIIPNLPPSYQRITSGLGEASPEVLVLVPLVHEDVCVGVIELAAFRMIPAHKIKFIELLSSQLTTTVHTTQLAQHTSQLLTEAKQQAEEMKVREEELQQNLEEMQSIQEDFTRKRSEYEKTIIELERQISKKKN